MAGDIEPLLQLQSAIDAACHACGHPLESRRFTPHITLARARTPFPPPVRLNVAQAIRQLGPSPVMQVTEFVLMQSQLSPKGARYQPVARFPLSEKST
jgi:2'-5' RNA ligase